MVTMTWGSLRRLVLGGLVAGAAVAGCTDEPEQPSRDAGTVSTCAPGVNCYPFDSGIPAHPVDASQPGLATDGAPSGSKPDDLPCDIKATVGQYCSACHKTGGSAPLPLESAADFRVGSKRDAGKTLLATVAQRLTSTVNTEMMPPAGMPRPGADQVAAIQQWLAAGAPARTTGSCGGTVDPTPTPPPVPPEATCFKMLAHAPGGTGKYKVGYADNAYINMSFKAPWGDKTRYAISMRPVIDNAQVLHHWLLFQEDGIDGAVVPGTGAHPGGQLLTGWAPGGDGVDLIGNPDDVGYEMPSQIYTIEFHYVSSDLGAEDQSGVEICMMDHQPRNIAALSWVGKDNLGLPDTHWVGQCRPASSAPIHIVGVTPHAHLQANRMKGVINRKDGTKEVLHDLPFDFNYQRSYKKDVVLQPGDTITTECWYNQPKSFGERTDQEMCYLFTYAYPKGALADPFSLWGGVAHGGSACLSE